jgi:hypothetical protein
MIFNSITCTVLYDLHSTKSTSWFGEWWKSNSNLGWWQLRNSVKLSSLMPKQIQYTAMAIDWSDLLSSKQLQMLESSILHGWASLDSYGLGTILAPIAPNSSCKLPASEDSTKILQKQWWIIDELMKKSLWKMEKKWENSCDFLFGSENMRCNYEKQLWLRLYTSH